VAPATFFANQERSTTSIITNLANATANAGWTYEDVEGAGAMVEPNQSVLANVALPADYRGGMLADAHQPLIVYVDMRGTLTEGDRTAAFMASCTPDQGGALYAPIAAKRALGLARASQQRRLCRWIGLTRRGID